MNFTPQDRAAVSGSAPVAPPPPPHSLAAVAAARPGPPPATPEAGAGGPGSASPARPCTGDAPGIPGGVCGHGEAVHHGTSDRDTASTECSVLLGPRGTRCGCKRYEAGAAQ